MAVTAVLVYELHGATRAQHAALRDALALLLAKSLLDERRLDRRQRRRQVDGAVRELRRRGRDRGRSLILAEARGKVSGRDRPRTVEDHQTLDEILHFADIAGPRIELDE